MKKVCFFLPLTLLKLDQYTLTCTANQFETQDLAVCLDIRIKLNAFFPLDPWKCMHISNKNRTASYR